MNYLRIIGGRALQGELEIQGAKNSVLPILAATLLNRGQSVLHRCPRLQDVDASIRILRRLGCSAEWEGDTLCVHTGAMACGEIPDAMMREMRSSVIFLGAILARCGHAVLSYPGGCELGPRPIDLHLAALRAMGVEIEEKGGYLHCCAQKLRGCEITLSIPSVGATENVILAACGAEGATVLCNAAREPEIVDLQNFLNACGADVRGAGTDVIKIRGVKQLRGGAYSIIPDQIEAGTYMAAVAAAGGDVLIQNVIPKHLDCITAKLVEMGVDVEELDDAVRVRRSGPISRANVKTMPYPGFPTDMQPQIAAVLCLATGTSVLTEGVWDSRYRYVDEFRRMGAHIQVDGKVAVIEGVPQLTGAPVNACDLRAGAAMVIAGLAAQGITEVGDIHHIERGYEDLVGKLSGVGANIKMITVPDEDAKSQVG